MIKTTIYPAYGSELNDASIRGRAYNIGGGEMLNRHETLAAFDRGEIEPRKIIHRNNHPSYHTRTNRHGETYMDHAGRAEIMTREELVAIFDAADAVKQKGH